MEPAAAPASVSGGGGGLPSGRDSEHADTRTHEWCVATRLDRGLPSRSGS